MFSKRLLFVGVQRSWHEGSKVLFVKKADSIVGSGIVSSVQQTSELSSNEREFCLAKNHCAKLVFKRLTRFHPPVPVQSTLLAGHNPLTLHGTEIGKEVVSAIESQVVSMIVI